MFGIELLGLLRVVIQISIAVVGASSLWGGVHLWRQLKAGGGTINEEAQFLANIFWRIFIASFTVFLLSWATGLWVFTSSILAHEGIKLPVTNEHIQQGFLLNTWFVSLLIIIGFISILLYTKFRPVFYKYGPWIFGSQFILASIIVSNTIWTGTFGREQLFHILHNWHSILTLGSVIVVDVFFLFTWYEKKSIREMIYRLFPFVSIGIWTGLGIDFASVWLIINEAWDVTSQFLFSQTIVSIIIINGALLSVRINDWLLEQVTTPNPPKATPAWQFILGLSGSISIVSWLTITFVDFFTLTPGYFQLMATWATVVVIAFITHHFTDKVMEKIYRYKNSTSSPSTQPTEVSM